MLLPGMVTDLTVWGFQFSTELVDFPYYLHALAFL